MENVALKKMIQSSLKGNENLGDTKLFRKLESDYKLAQEEGQSSGEAEVNHLSVS